MSLENIVRPFQTPTRVEAVRIEEPGQREIRRVLLQFGRNGSGKMLNGSSSISVSYYCVKAIVEKDQLVSEGDSLIGKRILRPIV